MEFEFLDSALAEASAAAEWYDQQVPALGKDFLEELERALASVGELPGAWPELRGTRERTYRRFLLSRFPHALIYTVMPTYV